MKTTFRAIVVILMLVGARAHARSAILWQKDLGEYDHVRADAELNRIFISPYHAGDVVALDRQGSEVWRSRTDTCYTATKDSRKVWVSQGNYGIILDGFTGKQLLRSKPLRGVHPLKTIELSPAPGDWCGYDAVLTPDGRTFFSAKWIYEDEESQMGLKFYEAVGIDAITGKRLWRGKKHAYMVGIWPDRGTFSVNFDGIVNRDGEVLWVNRDAGHFNLNECLDKVYPDRIWTKSGWTVAFQDVSPDGRFIAGQESGLPSFEGKVIRESREKPKQYIYVNPGDPGRPWQRKKLDFEASHETIEARFSDDGEYLLVRHEETWYPGRVRPPVVMSLFKTSGNGSPEWTKTVEEYMPLGAPACGQSKRVHFYGDRVLVDFQYFADVYSLRGDLIKRIVVPSSEGKTAFCDYWLLDEQQFAFLVQKVMHQKGSRLELWIGRLDDPD